MARLAKKTQQKGEKRSYTSKPQIKTVDELLRKTFGDMLPDTAVKEVSAKVSGYVLGGEKYTSWEEVEKCLGTFFWKEADGAETSLSGSDTEKAVQKDCSACPELSALLEEIQRLKEETTAARQKLKATETDYNTKFNNILGERNVNLEKISLLVSERDGLAEKCVAVTDELENSKKSVARLKRELEKSSELQKAKDQAEYECAEAKRAQKKAEEQEKKTRGELINCQGRISDLEKSLKDYQNSNGGESFSDNSSKSQLKKTINALKDENRSLEVKLKNEHSDKEKVIDEITALKCSYNAKQVQVLQKERNDAYELYNMASADIDKLTGEKNRLEKDLKEAKENLAAEKRNNETLKSSLNSKEKSSAGGEGKGIFSNDGSLFYDGEMADLFLLLAERNMKRLEGEKDVYKREYDLSKKVVETLEKSGWQEKMREKLDTAAKAEDIRAFQRLGFEDAGGSKHDKFYYHGDPRYMLVVSVTPSDGNSWKACSKQAQELLLLNGARKAE